MLKKPFIAANWKAKHTLDEVSSWIKDTKEELIKIDSSDIVICPPTIYLPFLYEEFTNSKVRIGAQDVSRYEAGAYTGEVSAKALSSFCTYAIVGHSERKKYFNENEAVVGLKVKRLLEVGLIPILCVADTEELEKYIAAEPIILSESQRIVFVYEPPRAISTEGNFHPEDPSDADHVISDFRSRLGQAKIIYGGSTNPENIASFLKTPSIDGALVGQASWEPQSFLQLVKASLS